LHVAVHRFATGRQHCTALFEFDGGDGHRPRYRESDTAGRARARSLGVRRRTWFAVRPAAISFQRSGEAAHLASNLGEAI
jgi:hypothetical protein